MQSVDKAALGVDGQLIGEIETALAYVEVSAQVHKSNAIFSFCSLNRLISVP